MFAQLTVIDDPVPRSGPLNMAIDEVLLGTARSATLRFYRWSAPSASFGYFLKFAEAREIAGYRTTVRRWTGGGVVPHGQDLTYSIMIGSSDDVFVLPAKSIYQRVHSALSQALRKIGIEAAIIETESPKISEACFANPVVSDVIENGHKIAGAAQRKTRNGLLHQGSIQSANLDDRFRTAFATLLSNQITPGIIEAAVLDSAQELAAKKYATAAWLHRR